MLSIQKSSTELNNVPEPRWHFPSALNPETHAEWGLYKILEYMGLNEILPPGAGQNRSSDTRTAHPDEHKHSGQTHQKILGRDATKYAPARRLWEP